MNLHPVLVTVLLLSLSSAAAAQLWPGTFEDLAAQRDFTDVTAGNDVIPMAVGDDVHYRVFSVLSTFVGEGPLFVFASLLPTGASLPSLFPGLWLDPSAVVLVNASIPGAPTQLPALGYSLVFQHPGLGLSGTSIFLQGIVTTSVATNGIFAGTNGLELRLM